MSIRPLCRAAAAAATLAAGLAAAPAGSAQPLAAPPDRAAQVAPSPAIPSPGVPSPGALLDSLGGVRSGPAARSLVLRPGGGVGVSTGAALDAAVPGAAALDAGARVLAHEGGQAPRPGLAVQQTLLSNVVVNRANAWLFGAPWARDVDFETWSRNLRVGWTWDEDKFTTNMFGHPYQGSFYHNAGRANGLSYWESAPLTVLGSWTWEYFGETDRPSLNDFFTTTFGGIALGEMTHRVAATVRNTEARGAGRIAREALSLVIDPVGGLNRLARGQWTRVAPNPVEHDPGAVFFSVGAGVRNVFEGGARSPVADERTVRLAPVVVVDVGYGDAFERPFAAPFDVFSMHLQASPSGGLNNLSTSGRLYQAALPSLGTRAPTAFFLSHRFDYANNPRYRFGGQSIDAGLLTRVPLAEGFVLRARAAGGALVMGAVSPPPETVGETPPGTAPAPYDRSYDFGPGLGAQLDVSLVRRRAPILSVLTRAEYLHTVSGTPADHVLAATTLRAVLPLRRGVGAGVLVSGDVRTSSYPTRPDITRRFVESRLLLTWTSTRRPAPLVTD